MTDANEDRWAAVVSDPDHRSATGIEAQLAPLGLDTVLAPRPEDVSAAVRRHGRVLILTAPPGDAGRAGEWCREWQKGAKQCYVAFLLRRYRAEDVAAAFECGADDVLIKPLIPVELRARLSRAVQMLALEHLQLQANGEAVLLSEISARSPLHSRRYLQEQLGNELDRARRFAHALAVIMAQVVGTRQDERLLRNFGVFLNRYVRGHVDWVARYTDRTFALVLPETTLLGAVRAAHRLRAALNQSALLAAGLPQELKASFGVSAMDTISASDAMDPQALMASAESFLREAVQTGPDRIIAGRAAVAH